MLFCKKYLHRNGEATVMKLYQFSGMRCLKMWRLPQEHSVCSMAHSSAFKMEAICSSETSHSYYKFYFETHDRTDELRIFYSDAILKASLINRGRISQRQFLFGTNIDAHKSITSICKTREECHENFIQGGSS
jgi:hypothetical protein